MNLEPGLILGNYRLVEKIGEGGMGVVWKGIDTSLDRDVAIKILPDHFASDPERLSRFEREAKLLASLNHPGIATIHGFHDVDGVRFLAMELVGGVDLAQRLSAGPMPVEEALEAGLRIAQALEAAHESGVVHRDLKPANIKLEDDGTVKILDFGLAKALEPEMPEGGSLSPTLTTPATRAGVILGTAAYMSPEQAKGKPVDRRADIWAFGCVLFEMLTGKRPFRGDGVSEILAAVIMAPAPFEKVPASVPPAVRRLLGRCLEKDSYRRLRDMGEVRFLLEETLAGGVETVETDVPRPAARRISFPVLAAGMIIAAVVGAALVHFFAPEPPAPPVRRFEIATEGPYKGNRQGRLLAVSPDGMKIAYVQDSRLMIRPIDRLEPHTIETASVPDFIFWSPDSAWIAYAEGEKLWRAPADGGPGASLVDLPAASSGGSGGAWGPDGRIAIALGTGALYEVPARGGDVEVIAEVDADRQESDFHEPCFLPDGSLIVTVHRLDGRPDRLIHLDGDSRTTLLAIDGQDIWYPVYSPTGHILYRRHPVNPGLWALPFSIEEGVMGKAFLVSPEGDVPSVSNDGTLVHASGAVTRRAQLVWVDREGTILGPIGQPREMWPFPELSADERYLALSAIEGENNDILILDVERETTTRLTFDDVVATGNVSWTLPGDRLYFEDGLSLPMVIKTKPSDGSAEAEELTRGWGPAVTPDGRYLIFSNRTEADGEGTGWDLFYIDLNGPGEPVRFLDEVEDQFWARVSPDGKYVAYLSFVSETEEVFIKPFPSGAGKWQVSIDGGHWPRWSRDGKTIYYVHEETIMEVDVSVGPPLRLGRPRPLFTREPLGWSLMFAWPPGFDVSDDEQRFVIATPSGQPEATGIIVVENWLSEFSD